MKITIPNSNLAEKVALTSIWLLSWISRAVAAQELALLAFVQYLDVVFNVLLNIDFVARSLVVSNENREQDVLRKVAAQCGGLAPQRTSWTFSRSSTVANEAAFAGCHRPDWSQKAVMPQPPSFLPRLERGRLN